MPASLEDWRNAATIASAAISLLALFRPELQKFFALLRGSLLIYPVGERVEIGFAGAGATTGLEVILRARSRDFFVRDADLEVVRLRDNARHSLSWGALRPPTLIAANQQLAWEVPAGFLLEPKSPRRIYIAFQDRELRDEMSELLNALREQWWDALRDAGLFPPPQTPGDDNDYRVALRDLYEQFFNEQTHVTTWQALQRICYWQPGNYAATLKIYATEPEQTFTLRFSFTLSQTDSDRLYGNAIAILRQNVGFADASPIFAYPKLEVPPAIATKKLRLFGK